MTAILPNHRFQPTSLRSAAEPHRWPENMRIAPITICFYACALILYAEEPIEHCPLRAYASYPHISLNTNRSVTPGDKISIMISIRNTSSNLIVLSLDSSLYYQYEGKPNIVLSNFTNEATGSITTYIAPGGGGGARSLAHPYTFCSPPNASAYVFIEPDKSFVQDIMYGVPENLGDFPFSTMEYSATIHADDSGKEYGLNAWTGTLKVTGCTIPLRKSKQENGQPTNAPYSQPQTVEKR